MEKDNTGQDEQVSGDIVVYGGTCGGVNPEGLLKPDNTGRRGEIITFYDDNGDRVSAIRVEEKYGNSYIVGAYCFWEWGCGIMPGNRRTRLIEHLHIARALKRYIRKHYDDHEMTPKASLLKYLP